MPWRSRAVRSSQSGGEVVPVGRRGPVDLGDRPQAFVGWQQHSQGVVAEQIAVVGAGEPVAVGEERAGRSWLSPWQ